MRKILRRIFEWYLNHFELYLTICQSNEHAYVGRRLWKEIDNALDDEQKKDIRIWFKKYPRLNGKGYEYIMVVNPDLSEYEQELFTAPLQYNVYGHIGFQSVQPTPAEIVYEYGIDCGWDERVMIRLEKTSHNGELAFVLRHSTIHNLFNPRKDDETSETTTVCAEESGR